MSEQGSSKELIRNLRAHAEDAHDNGLTGSARTCARAADEIERLQILVTERLETFIQTAGKDRRVLADYIATHEPQPAASNQWGIDEAFKTLQLLTNGSPSATGAMSFLRSQIERLQQYVGLLERQNQKQSQTISESQRSTPLHGGGGASNEPPSGLPAPNVATLMSDLLDWASDAEDDETNNNGSSIVSAEGLRKLCYRAHAALSRASQPPPAECQRCHCMEKARAGGEIGVMNFTHWSKDPLVPYAGCICSSCEEARQQIVTTCSGSTKCDGQS